MHPELLVSGQGFGRDVRADDGAGAARADRHRVPGVRAVLSRRVGTRWLGDVRRVYLVSLGAELAGTTVGLPFGPYRYTDGLGWKWFEHVPALIPASWYMMALPSYAIACWRFPKGTSVVARVALGSFILLSWDLALDPAMSLATKYWVWGTDGPVLRHAAAEPVRLVCHGRGR